MCRKCPDHPSTCLLTTDSGRSKVLTGCYFFACLVFSPHDMNVFVIDLTANNVVTHVQGSKATVWLLYTLNMQYSDRCTRNVKTMRVIFPAICFIWNATFHAVLCSCMFTVLPYTFSQVSDRSCNYKGVELPSGCVVPGSRSIHTFGCCFVNCREGAEEVDHFRLPGPPGLSTMPGWYKVCEIGRSEQQVHLQPLCCMWSSGCSFGFCIPVSSLQYQLNGKLKGRGSFPHRWARQNWSAVCS